ncbi:MAG: hypothetical protein ACP5QI_06560 [Candidatus Bathyarchaeia archaeon]
MADQGVGGGRKLIIVPRMYTEEEIMLATGKRISMRVKDEIKSFWSNLEEQLSKLGRIDKVYRDMITADGDEGIRQLSTMDPYNYRIVKSLLERGAELMATEDPLLVEEAEAWVGTMALGSPSALELFRDNLSDRNRYIAERIDTTLGRGEVGILFIEPSRNVEFPEGLEVLRVELGSSDLLRSLIGGKKVE